jgi:hypothetical protein
MSPRNQERKQAKRQNPSVLNEVLEHRMLLYVLAAGATLAGASAAQGRVVYTPSKAILTVGDRHIGRSSLQIDLNNDGTIGFVLTEFYHETGLGYYSSLKANAGQPLNGIVKSSQVSRERFAAALKRGTPIGSGAKFGSKELMAFRNSESTLGTYSAGNFLNITSRYLGVKFVINGEVHYGWIGFRSVTVGGFHDHGELTAKVAGWAYETEPNKPIVAGAMGEQDSESNSAALRSAEPTSLELLAAGNVAIDDWRRRIAN